MSGNEDIVLVRRQPLDSTGICSKCEHKADDECMKCAACDEMYHVINCPPGNKTGQVTATFYGGWESMERNYPNILYMCTACLQDKNFKKDIIVSNRMCSMEEEMKNLKLTMDEKLGEMREMMQKLVQNKEQPVELTNAGPTPVESYADKVRGKPSRSVIVIKKKGNGESADIEKIHQAAVNTNASVSNAYKNNCGDTVVVCENQESKDSLLPALQADIDSEHFDVVTPPQRVPTITIIDMHREYSKEDVLERVKNQNSSKFSGVEINEDTFKVLSIRKQLKNDKLFKAVVRVSNEVRHAIQHRAGDKLNIGLTSCPVYDEYFVKRCNRCQCYNHWKNDCTADQPVCGRCGENHDTRNCNSPALKCFNCVQAKYTNTNHETSSRDCKTYKDAQNKLKSTINYYKHLN